MDSIFCKEEALLDGLLHRLEPVDPFISRIICYPWEKCKELEERIRIMRSYGVKGLLNYGGVTIDKGMHIIGKGYSSIVVLSCINGVYTPIVLKIRRLDSRRKSLEYEGIILDYLSSSNYTPALYFWTRDFIAMEYINGLSLEKFIQQTIVSDRAFLLKTLIKIISSSYFFDLLGIDHTELNRPYGHVFVTKKGYPVYLDWESARIRRKPHNLTMIASYLFIRSRYSEKILEILNIEKDHIINHLHRYKNDPTTEYLWLIKLVRKAYQRLV